MITNSEKKIGGTEILVGLAAMIPLLYLRSWAISHIWNTSTTVHLGTVNAFLIMPMLIIYGLVTSKNDADSGKSGYLYNIIFYQIVGCAFTLGFVGILHLFGLMVP